MIKVIIILSFVVAACSPTKVKEVKQEPLSEVTKIDFLDDGNTIVYIKTDSLAGIITNILIKK
ncbi:hypothetical protein [Flavobacterium aquatile]|uniref:Lipoprotein n=1 Tax=Flavobacterium aquatile LMG 4008 = ATCC 11947 TaxID=1453498 RepID=A0A095SY65_9FLAO|nr:hypothetical protein [Flavobacterium aquatile]KGD69601.1 hypothetical protein LG45_02260 [Flavobacterium aquatile LMG 4008 = ATCC 11947]OXA67260.1 hypothetical protein B0A61_08620 [Flavobacterium aquatile LMG 4008 = ATCC 11947]GEC77918.1 hypothetical protein FAQ01_07880 [Flavobacterium aquatile]